MWRHLWCYKIFLFQINVLLKFLFIKESWKKCITVCVHKNIKQHNCFHHVTLKTGVMMMKRIDSNALMIFRWFYVHQSVIHKDFAESDTTCSDFTEPHCFLHPYSATAKQLKILVKWSGFTESWPIEMGVLRRLSHLSPWLAHAFFFFFFFLGNEKQFLPVNHLTCSDLLTCLEAVWLKLAKWSWRYRIF